MPQQQRQSTEQLEVDKGFARYINGVITKTGEFTSEEHALSAIQSKRENNAIEVRFTTEDKSFLIVMDQVKTRRGQVFYVKCAKIPENEDIHPEDLKTASNEERKEAIEIFNRIGKEILG